jgi:hypothetical protein
MERLVSLDGVLYRGSSAAYSGIRKTYVQIQVYLYTSQTHLRPLQGICVPNIIGIYNAHGGKVIFNTEVPHHVGWRTAGPNITPANKDAIVEAYKTIHSRGIMHNSVAFRHILIGRDLYLDYTEIRLIRPMRYSR